MSLSCDESLSTIAARGWNAAMTSASLQQPALGEVGDLKPGLAGRLGVDQAKSEHLGQGEHVVVVAVDELAAEFGVDVWGHGPVVRLDAAADVVRPFVKRHVEPGLSQQVGRVQAGDARPHDRDSRLPGLPPALALRRSRSSRLPCRSRSDGGSVRGDGCPRLIDGSCAGPPETRGGDGRKGEIARFAASIVSSGLPSMEIQAFRYSGESGGPGSSLLPDH